MELRGQLCPGGQVGSEGQKAMHPLTRSLQECLPQLLLLWCGVHPGHLEPIAAAWIRAEGGEGHGHTGHPRSQGAPAGFQIRHCHSQFSVDTKAQERVEKYPRPHAEPVSLSIRSPRGPAPLTSAQAEACAPQLAAGQGPMFPDGELSTGLA